MANWVAVGALILHLLFAAGCKAQVGWAEDLGMDMCPEKELSPSYMGQLREDCLSNPLPQRSVQPPNIPDVGEMQRLVNKQQMQLEQLETLVAVLQDTVFQLQSAVAATTKLSGKGGDSDSPVIKDTAHISVHGSYEDDKHEKELRGT